MLERTTQVDKNEVAPSHQATEVNVKLFIETSKRLFQA